MQILQVQLILRMSNLNITPSYGIGLDITLYQITKVMQLYFWFQQPVPVPCLFKIVSILTSPGKISQSISV